MVKRNVFKEKVIAIVKKIPKGKTLSYKDVAGKAGHPGAARAVGAIMRTNTDASVPCHRVIMSDGALGGYNGIRGEKEKLLRKEKAI
jgi:O-6-methylguanine DNA methyltransferase